MTSTLKAYCVDAGGFSGALVFAKTSKEAKKLGSKFVDPEEWIELTSERREPYDIFLRADATEPYVEHYPEVLRQANWQYEDEYTCNSCGLAAMGIDQYEVCDDCGECLECGHQDDCPNSDKGDG